MSIHEFLSVFDRWLAERDREVAEKAWDEGANDVWSNVDPHTRGVDRNPYRTPQYTSKEKTDG